LRGPAFAGKNIWLFESRSGPSTEEKKPVKKTNGITGKLTLGKSGQTEKRRKTSDGETLTGNHLLSAREGLLS